MLVKAMEKAGSTTDLKAIATAIYSLHYAGLLSSYEHFDPAHHLRFNVDGCLVPAGADPTSHVQCSPVNQ